MTAKESSAPITVGMVLFPNLTQLDLTGPYEVFVRMSNTRVCLLATALAPVRSERGLAISPDTTFDDAPSLDVLFVPGGPGVSDVMEDETFLDFLREQGRQARYITSVCTGALLLGAAGLLKGYRATTHWLSMDFLDRLGARPVSERVVIDRNRITGGGVTAGIDFSLVIAAQLRGEDAAKEIQLSIEYDPQPPFRSGSPRTAEGKLVQTVIAARRDTQELRRQQVERVALRLSRSK